MTVSGDDLIEGQIAYYRARAAEYDEWFLRRGRYDQGEAHARQWFAEVEQVQQALAAFGPRGDVLELACGTGWWTQRLEPWARTLTAVDAAAEVIALNKQRLKSAKVNYVHADIFQWQAVQTFDAVFFSFWLSHVPLERFSAFWQSLRSCLKKGGRVFFVDSLYHQAATAKDQSVGGPDEEVVTRRLNDGRTFDIVKIFYRPEQLAARLEALGWQAEVQQTERFFLYGSAAPA